MQLDIGLIKLTWYLSRMCDGWVIDNLLEYGNSALPDELVEKHGVEKVERELSKATGYIVLIETRWMDKDPTQFVNAEDIKKKREKEVLYVAVRL